jgi:tetratricopeptide (TPR) repeat protein
MSDGRVPKLPLIAVHSSTKSSPRAGTLVSSSKTRYVATGPADGDSTRVLTPRDIRQITKYIHANKPLQPQHRAGRLSDLIPAVPFQRLQEQGDTLVGLQLARINPKESALDIPLRFALPADYHVPAMNDLPMQAGVSSSLGTRIMALLKGTSQVPHHSPEEQLGTEKDVAHCTIIRDWEMRANVARRAEQARPHAIALLALGALHYRAANKEKSLRYFTDSAVAFEKAGDARGAALCHNLLGVSTMHVGRPEEALLHHRKQGALCGVYGRCVAQLNLGTCYAAMGEHDSAVQALEDALRSATEANDDVLTAIAHGNLGIALMRVGDVRQAQFHTEACLERCSIAGDKVGAGICLLLLADLYSQLGDYQHAQFYAEHALRVANEAGCVDVADVAKVTVGVARGAQNAQATLMDSARRMGTVVTAGQIIATLPRN